MNEKKIIVALLGILITLNLIGGVFLISQQKEIDSLSSGVGSGNLLGIKNSNTSADISGQIEARIKEALVQEENNNQKQILGNIKSVTKDAITVGTLMGGAKEIVFNVKIDDKTQFEGKELTDLLVGDVVNATSDSSVYGKLDFTATKITFVLRSQADPSQEMPKEAIGNKYLSPTAVPKN
jgi:hypothetical protein